MMLKEGRGRCVLPTRFGTIQALYSTAASASHPLCGTPLKAGWRGHSVLWRGMEGFKLTDSTFPFERKALFESERKQVKSSTLQVCWELSSIICCFGAAVPPYDSATYK